MNRFLKSTILAAALAATTLAAMPAANAGHRHHHHSRGGDVLAAGALGLAVGAIAGGVLAQPRPAPVYVDRYPPAPPPRYYYRPAPEPVYIREAPEPWSRGWYQECSMRYRSFDPSSGTYLGYDGREHFCNLN